MKLNEMKTLCQNILFVFVKKIKSRYITTKTFINIKVKLVYFGYII